MNPALSFDGRYLAFESSDCNLLPGDSNRFRDIFVVDLLKSEIALVSVDSTGAQANGDCFAPSISADGRFIAFESRATNLVPGDSTRGFDDIFVHDRLLGTTVRASVDSLGVEANRMSQGAKISDDGRFVAFGSDATNLVPNDTNGVSDVFLHDLALGTTVRISVGASGFEADGSSGLVSLSGDGRIAAFSSSATNLVLGDTNATSDIFIRDLVSGVTSRVSVDSSGGEADQGSSVTALSQNGRFVAFASGATNLVPGDTNGVADIFVHDRATGVTGRVSVDSVGGQANDRSLYLQISADGRYVAFQSWADNLVPGDTNLAPDIFVRDLVLGWTARVSVSSSGVGGESSSEAPSISGDGSCVAFHSSGANLVDENLDSNLTRIYVRDVANRTTQWVTKGLPGLINGSAGGSSLSADGRFVGMSTSARLLPADENGRIDVLALDRSTGILTLASIFDYGQSTVDCLSPSLSDDGRYVAFATFWTASPVAYGDIYVRDLQAGITEQINVDPNGGPVGGLSRGPRISVDGRFVAFSSRARFLVPGDTSVNEDVFVRDRQNGVTDWISVDPGGGPSNGWAFGPSLSADSRWVAFYGSASNLVGGDTNASNDVFVRDRQLGVTFLVSVDSTGNQGNGDSEKPSISRDGRFVAFLSEATNLVPGDTNLVADVFVHDRLTGITSRVSVDSSGFEADLESSEPAISPDGRYVGFTSSATNLVPSDTNGTRDVFLHDRQTGQTKRVNVSSLGEQSNDHSSSPLVSDQARFIVFGSQATNLVPDGTQSDCGNGEVFLRDRIELRFNGTPSYRSLVNFTIANAFGEAGNRALILLSHSGTDGIALPNDPRRVYLTFDSWTSLGLQLSWVLSGSVDASGTAHTPIVPFPQAPVGLTVYAAGITFGSQGKFAGITAPITFVSR